MNKKFKLGMLVVWSIISAVLVILLVYAIRTGKGEELEVSTFTSSAGVQKEVAVDLDDCNIINLDFSSEDIKIIVTKEDKLKIVEKANKPLKEYEKFNCDKSGKSLNITQGERRSKTNFFGSSNSINRTIELFIPESYKKSVEIETSSGDVKVNGNLILTSLRSKQSSGEFEANETIEVEECELNATSGEICLKELLTKKYDIKTSSGDIEIRSISGSGEIRATSGEIEIGYKAIGEYSRLEASSGDIRISLPKDLSFDFDGECSSGNINSSFDLNYKNKKRNRAEAKSGNGPYKRLSVRTTSGDININ